MSSYRQILYQIIFATKERKESINETHCEDLYKYIWGIINENKCKLYRINGVSDHIHIACDLHPAIALADFVKKIKTSSSIWMKSNDLFPKFTAWGEGYGAFTYSFRDKSKLIEYIKNQKEHHKQVNFFDEYLNILKEHGLQYDERYLPW